MLSTGLRLLRCAGLRCVISALRLARADWDWPFHYCESVALRKTYWLAGYAAVQHFAWDVMDVMTIQVARKTLDVNVKRRAICVADCVVNRGEQTVAL